MNQVQNPTKILFLMFDDSICKQLHALIYALDLYEKKIEVKIIFEGPSTKLFTRLPKIESQLAEDNLKDISCDCASEDLQTKINHLLIKCIKCGIVAGICLTASKHSNADINATLYNVKLLGDIEGHASITQYLIDGYQIITF